MTTTSDSGGGAAAEEARGASLQHVLVISGTSGSGKSTAMHAVEDLGFFVIDNVPVSISSTVIDLCAQNPEVQSVALAIDAREGRFLEGVGATLDRLAERAPLRVLWLDAADDVLRERYRMTRRRHPLGDDLQQAVHRERELLKDVASRATDTLDTTRLSPHDLRAKVQSLVVPGDGQRFRILLQSFGFKHGGPRDTDHVLDVRFLPNPYWDETLRAFDGRSDEIRTFMADRPEVASYLAAVTPAMSTIAALSRDAARGDMTVGVGCTGGHHRSVFVVERLSESLAASGFVVEVRHRDL